MKRQIPQNSKRTCKVFISTHERVRRGTGARWKVIAASVILLFAAACRVEEQREADDIRNEQALNIAVYLYSEEGNCVHNYKQSTNLGRLTCSRSPRSRCDFYRQYSTAGILPVASETQTRYRSDWSTLTKDITSCSTALAASFALPGLRTTSATFNENALGINELHTIVDCANLGNASSGKLATREQYKFLISPLGILATQARSLNQTTCLDQLLGSSTERSWVDAVGSSSLVLETTCLYGANAFTSVCTTSEKAEANRFDFTGSL